MNGRTLVGAVAVGIFCSVAVGEARVTRIEILKVEPAPAPAGAAGQYQKITGKAHGQLDPSDPKNALITDIQFAPRNASGKVEYIATFALIKPVDMAKASGVLMYLVVNRGNGVPTASPDGHVSLVSGWQGDVLPTTINQTIQVPRAHNPDGSSITGPFVVRLTEQTGSTAALIIPRNTPSPYPPATLDTAKASLMSAASESATGVKGGVVKFSSSDWAFADCRTAPFPGTPDPAHLCVKGGFNPALLYELQYVVKDPLVLGVGLAATRDVNSFFRYEKQDEAGTPNPVAGSIRWAISEGSSQSGTFLRAYIRLGFNQDEKGRVVWDGSNPHIASRVIDLNRRFALPGGTVSAVRARSRSACLVGRLGRYGARTRHGGAARSMPRHPDLSENHGDVRFRRDLGAASIAHARGNDCQGRSAVAGQRSPLLLLWRDARRRARRLQHDDRSGRRLRAARQPGARGSHASGPARAIDRLGHQRRADAAEQVSNARRRHAGG